MRIPWNKNKTLVPIRFCPVCNKSFNAYMYNGKRKQFCSRSCSKTGKYSPLWKGGKVKYGALHKWIKKHLPNLNYCWNCGIKTRKLDLANLSGKYLRELGDWEYWCRKCHMTRDGRIEKLKKTQYKKGHTLRTGTKHTLETKNIIREKVKKLWQNSEYRKHMSEIHKLTLDNGYRD